MSNEIYELKQNEKKKQQEWKLETKVTNKLKECCNILGNKYEYREVEIWGRPYLCITDKYDDFWPERKFCEHWRFLYNDTRPIDVCNITMGPKGSFCVAEIMKRSWNSAPYEWRRHNREVIGY